MKLKLTALVAIVTAALFAQSVQAGTVTATTGDIILGFTDGTTCLEVDLGSYSSVIAGTVNTAGLKLADLTATYGSGWQSNGSLYWGVAGGLSGNLVLTSPDQPTPSTYSTQNGYVANLNKLTSTLNGLSSTANSGVAATIGAATAGSWDYQYYNPNPGTALNNLPNDSIVDGAANDGVIMAYASTSQMNLYKVLAGGAATKLGTLTLDGSGLSFQAQAIPEPSTFVCVGLGMLGLLAIRRRK